MIGDLWGPSRTLAVALGGALLAVFWIRSGHMWPLLLVVAVLGVVASARLYAKQIAHRNPTLALSLLELQLVGVLVVSAALAGVVIGVTVTFTLDEDVAKELSTSTKEIISAVGAAMTAFVSSLALKDEDVDDRIGKLVQRTFRQAFVTSGTPGSGQVFIDQSSEAGKRAAKAIDTAHDFGWTDWSKDNRAPRIAALAAYVRANA